MFHVYARMVEFIGAKTRKFLEETSYISAILVTLKLWKEYSPHTPTDLGNPIWPKAHNLKSASSDISADKIQILTIMTTFHHMMIFHHMMDFHHIMMSIHHKLYDSYKLYYCPRSLDRRASTQLVASAHSVACPLVLLNNVILLASCTSSYIQVPSSSSTCDHSPSALLHPFKHITWV